MTQRSTSRLQARLLGLRSTSRRAHRWMGRRQRHDLESTFRGVRARFYEQFWARAAEVNGARIRSIGHGYSVVSKDSSLTFVDATGGFTDSRLGTKMAMNKPLIHELFGSDSRYRFPRHCRYSLPTIARADAFLGEIQGPVVVKPAQGGYAGRGVTAGISTPQELRTASVEAASYSPDLMVEEHVGGKSFRLLFLEGDLLQVIRRGAPTVTGNGSDSIKELMDAETRRRGDEESIRSLHPLLEDLDCRIRLASDGRSLRSVPAPGEIVEVKSVVNQNSSDEAEILDADVADSLMGLGAAISSTLVLPLVGLDVITDDLSADLEATGGCVNEVNAQPGLHHHRLVRNPDEGVDVGAAVLEFALANAPDVTADIAVLS